jgi:hypothetical protein
VIRHAQGAAALKAIPGLQVVEEENVRETTDVQKTMENRLEGGRTLGVGLVVAVIVLRPDIDEADGERAGGAGAAEGQPTPKVRPPSRRFPAFRSSRRRTSARPPTSRRPSSSTT